MNHFISKKTIQKIMAIFVILILSNFIMSAKAQAQQGKWMSIKEYQNLKVGGTDIKQDLYDENSSPAVKIICESWKITAQEAIDILRNHENDEATILVEQETGFNTVYKISEVKINPTEEEKAKYSITTGSDGTASVDTTYWSNKNNETEEDEPDYGLLFSPITMLLTGIADTVNRIMEVMIVGYAGYQYTESKESSGLVPYSDNAERVFDDSTYKVTDFNDESEDVPLVKIERKYIDKSAGAGPFSAFIGTYRISCINLTPAEIFAGNVAALNANFFSSDEDYSGMLGGKEKSVVRELKGVVSAWYVAIRNIAIVGLLSVLLYLGIRIIISSSAGDKAKYKQTFMDWVVALCLIFFLHYIMAFTMTISDQVTSVLGGNETKNGTISEVRIALTDDGTPIDGRGYYGSLVDVARIKIQYDKASSKLGYTVLYIAFTAYTVNFIIVYMKRLLMLAFYTLMAPAVALSYPLDKLKDGKAQAFNFWLKDYIFYAFLPALHMILYKVFISSALSLAASNMLYAIIAMAFIVPAEKIVKKMFGIHGNTEERAGGFAGGAVAATLMNGLKRIPKGGKGPSQAAGGKQRIPTVAHNPNSINFMDTMNALSGQKASARQTQQQSSQQQQAQQAAEQNKKQEQEKEARNQALLDQGINDPEEFRNRDPEYARELENAYMEKHSDEQTEGQTVPGTENNGNNDDNNFETRLDLPPEMSNPEPKIHNEEPQEKRSLKDNFKKAASRRWKLAGGGKGIAKKLGKSAIKGLGTAAGMTALGMAGLGIGMVGGDLGDAVKGLSVGAAAGGFLGSRATDAVGNALSGNGTIGSFASEVMYGGVEESNNHRAREAYVSNRSVRESILNDHPEFNTEQIEEYAKRRYDMMYESGNDDEKLADKAIKLEDALVAQGQSEYQAHRSAAGALGAVSKYSFSDLADESKRQKYEKQVSDRVMEESNGNITQEVAEERARSYFDNMAVLRGVQSAPKAPKTSKTTKGTNKINRTDKK